MKRLPFLRPPLQSRSGAGSTEYIVIIVLVLGLIVGVFWDLISGVIRSKVDNIGESITMKKPTSEEEGGKKTSAGKGALSKLFGGGSGSGSGNGEITYGSTSEQSTGPVRGY